MIFEGRTYSHNKYRGGKEPHQNSVSDITLKLIY